jgi:hypothetical protein
VDYIKTIKSMLERQNGMITNTKVSAADIPRCYCDYKELDAVKVVYEV